MYKVIILIQKRDDWSREEFLEYWRTEHVTKAEEMPGVAKYTTAEIVDEDAEYDGVAELYFEDPGDIEPAFESDAGQRTLEDAEHFTAHHETQRYTVDQEVHLDETE
jgi:uncharacterized protein (TIGR02118 family)